MKRPIWWCLIDLLFAFVCILAIFSCGRPTVTGPGPSPNPTPAPSPPLPAYFRPPLRATASGFVDGSGAVVRVKFVSYIPPESKLYGWPTRVTRDALEPIAKACVGEGIVCVVAVRLGPFTRDGEGLEHVAYDSVGDLSRVNLEAWNPAFWAAERAFAREAHDLGLYVEFDMIDAWVLERPELSPWSIQNNVNGVDIGNCTSLSGRPFEPQLRWIDKIMQELGAEPNVMFQIGNETASGNCTTDGGRRELLNDAWELAIYAQAKLGTQHPVGTNSQRPAIIAGVDYAQFHTCDLPVGMVADKPYGANEWDCRLTAEQFCARQPSEPHKWFGLWADGWTREEWDKALECMT